MNKYTQEEFLKNLLFDEDNDIDFQSSVSHSQSHYPHSNEGQYYQEDNSHHSNSYDNHQQQGDLNNHFYQMSLDPQEQQVYPQAQSILSQQPLEQYQQQQRLYQVSHQIGENVYQSNSNMNRQQIYQHQPLDQSNNQYDQNTNFEGKVGNMAGYQTGSAMNTNINGLNQQQQQKIQIINSTLPRYDYNQEIKNPTYSQKQPQTQQFLIPQNHDFSQPQESTKAFPHDQQWRNQQYQQITQPLSYDSQQIQINNYSKQELPHFQPQSRIELSSQSPQKYNTQIPPSFINNNSSYPNNKIQIQPQQPIPQVSYIQQSHPSQDAYQQQIYQNQFPQQNYFEQNSQQNFYSSPQQPLLQQQQQSRDQRVQYDFQIPTAHTSDAQTQFYEVPKESMNYYSNNNINFDQFQNEYQSQDVKLEDEDDELPPTQDIQEQMALQHEEFVQQFPQQQKQQPQNQYQDFQLHQQQQPFQINNESTFCPQIPIQQVNKVESSQPNQQLMAQHQLLVSKKDIKKSSNVGRKFKNMTPKEHQDFKYEKKCKRVPDSEQQSLKLKTKEIQEGILIKKENQEKTEIPQISIIPAPAGTSNQINNRNKNQTKAEEIDNKWGMHCCPLDHEEQDSHFEDSAQNDMKKDKDSQMCHSQDQMEVWGETEEEREKNTQAEEIGILAESIKHCNKKNVVKNIMSAFLTYMKDSDYKFYTEQEQKCIPILYHQSPSASLDDEDLRIDEIRKKFKRYITKKSLNHYTARLLILHNNYGPIFRHYLMDPIKKWINNSKVADLSAHTKMIGFFLACFQDNSALQELKHHEKKRAHFS